jgi:hypothetical protein
MRGSVVAAAASLALTISVPAHVSASVTVGLEETFESGAQFNGTLTFDDSTYSILTGVTGSIAGGYSFYSSDNFTYVENYFYYGTNQSCLSGLCDRLIAGDSSFPVSQYIVIGWNENPTGQDPFTLLSVNIPTYAAGILSYLGSNLVYPDPFDPVVSYEVTSYSNPPMSAVPLPGTLSLFGTAIVGFWALAARRRVKQAA